MSEFELSKTTWSLTLENPKFFFPEFIGEMRENFFTFGLTQKMTLAYPKDSRTNFNIIDESIIRGKNGAGGATDEFGLLDEEYLEGDERA
jgi:hypothetical protein